METDKVGITEELANFLGATRYEDFPQEVQHIAKNCIIDGIGVILAGSTEPCARIVRDYVLSLKGQKESTLLGRGKNKVPAHHVALVNGTAGHAMDWDDTVISDTADRSVLLHPTIPPLVAGLALGEKSRVSGRDFLTAFLTGFEIECKMAAAIDVDHRIRGFHTSGTCGIFGATAAATKLMGLSINKVRNAIGMAASMSAGLGVQTGTMTKPFHVGRAAENGIVCAQLSALGFEAHPNALEEHKGFFEALGGGFNSDKISGKLGRPFSIIEPGVSVKPYPCGVVGHSTIDAMRSLVIQHNIQPQEVEYVKVTTSSNILPPKGPLRYKKAQTALEAKFCVPFQMACMIIRRKAGILEFTNEFVQSPAVQNMMDRIEAVVDPELDYMGRNKYLSVIEVQLKDGRLLHGKSTEYVPGSPSSPLSQEELKDKFGDCVQQILNPDQARKLLETIKSLDSLNDIRTLIRMATVP